MKDFYIYDHIAVNCIGEEQLSWRYLTKLNGADYVVVQPQDAGVEHREGELLLAPIDTSKIVMDPEPWITDVNSRLMEPIDLSKMIRVQGVLHGPEVWPPEMKASSE